MEAKSQHQEGYGIVIYTDMYSSWLACLRSRKTPLVPFLELGSKRHTIWVEAKNIMHNARPKRAYSLDYKLSVLAFHHFQSFISLFIHTQYPSSDL